MEEVFQTPYPTTVKLFQILYFVSENDDSNGISAKTKKKL